MACAERFPIASPTSCRAWRLGNLSAQATALGLYLHHMAGIEPEAALAAGARCVAVPNEFTREALSEANLINPRFVAEDPADLPAEAHALPKRAAPPLPSGTGRPPAGRAGQRRRWRRRATPFGNASRSRRRR